MKRRIRNRKIGFTLIEIVLVIAIVMIMTTSVFVGITSFVDKANKMDELAAQQISNYDAARLQIVGLLPGSAELPNYTPPATTSGGEGASPAVPDGGTPVGGAGTPDPTTPAPAPVGGGEEGGGAGTPGATNPSGVVFGDGVSTDDNTPSLPIGGGASGGGSNPTTPTAITPAATTPAATTPEATNPAPVGGGAAGGGAAGGDTIDYTPHDDGNGNTIVGNIVIRGGILKNEGGNKGVVAIEGSNGNYEITIRQDWQNFEFKITITNNNEILFIDKNIQWILSNGNFNLDWSEGVKEYQLNDAQKQYLDNTWGISFL